MATEQGAVPISTAPAVGQLVEHHGKMYTTIKEGRAFILIPPNTRTVMDPQAKAKAAEGKDVPQNVFYNPIQQFNRDLSVLAIAAFGEELCGRRRGKREREGKKVGKRKERKGGKVEVGGNQDGVEGEAREVAPAGEVDGALQEAQRKLDEEVDRLAGGDVGLKQPKVDHEAEVETLVQLQGSKRKADDLGDEQALGEAGIKRQRTEEHISGANGRDVPAMMVQNNTGAGAETSVAAKESNGANGTSNTGSQPNGHPDPPEWQPRFRILDALSATGLRALRYASEIPFATAVTANDMDRGAVASIRTNVEYNKLSGKITPNLGNAMGHMYTAAFPPTDSHGPHHISGRYDVIDLDPYGSAAPFIESALQALNDGGMLCVTCTDSGVFASCGYSEKTFSLYGGMPIKGNHSHEGGLRLIINSVATAAAKYGLAIEPLLSLSIDFYVRIFIRVTKSPADVKFLAGKTMVVYDCDNGCGAWTTQFLGRNTRQVGKAQAKNPTFHFKHGIAQAPTADRHCEHCGSKTHIAGPMWGGPLHNAAFVEKLLKDASEADATIYQTKQRLEGMLDTALNELNVLSEADTTWTAPNKDATFPKTPPETLDLHPFFFIPSALAKVIHCIAPPEAAIKGALRHAGYKATRSHCKPGSIKTDAPWSVLWEVMREWVRQKQPIKEGALREGQAGFRIMQAARQKVVGSEAAEAVEGSSGDAMPAADGQVSGAGEIGKAEERKVMEVVFDEALGRDKPGKRLVRYQQNPRENWGPMTRAKGSA
ncbi:hypothetical protein LTR62_008403 [Meristemomyces frigidus]|uniref:tRNA (guanine(26)-N(2))-dimethyltransferase n=1 Tax=Meristemomyces frigidus TaxID=1508187 RepID=A0AAN7TAR2_9PEZI|nr:hypothetical protein LTR62_008403 [Meristemomyces frigidus]